MSNYERLFDENKNYVAEIVGQELTKSRDNQPTLVINVELRAQARAKGRIGDNDAPLEGARQVTRTLWLNLDPAGPKLPKVMKELKALGFTFTDIRRLHPGHPKGVSFLGQKVLVRPWYAPKYDEAGNQIGEVDKWFLVTPRDVEVFDYKELSEIFEGNQDAYSNAASQDE